MTSRLNHTIGRARRRRALNAGLAGGGLGLAVGAAAALGALVVSRVLGYEIPVAAYGAMVVIAFLAGAARALVSFPTAYEVALSLDRMMGLRDRLATAYALSAVRAPLSAPGQRAVHDAEFASIVRHEGEHLAGRIDVRSLTPVQVGGSWWIGLVLMALLAVGYLYLPAMAWGEDRQDAAIAAADEEAGEERERLRASIDEIMEEMREDPIDDPHVQEELDALQRLAEQLAAGTGDPADVQRARDESAARLNELADRLAEQARRDQEAADRLTERFAGLDAPERPMSAQEFDEALKRGDFGDAARAMEEQLQRRDAMTPEEQRELADHLRNTADRVDQISQEGDLDFEEREARLEQLMRDQGLDDEWMHDLMHGDEAARREAMERLEEFLADEEHAQRMQRELDRLHEERDLLEQLQRDLDAINDAMRDAADELDPEIPDSPDEPADGDEAADEDPDREERTPEASERPEETRPDGEDVREQQPAQEQEAAEQEAESDEQQVQQQEAEDDLTQPQEVAEHGEPDETAQERDAIEEEVSDPEADQEGAVPSPDEHGDPEQEQAAEGASEDPQQAQDQRRSPSEVIREVEERRRAAERRQQASERARQRARELADAPQRDLQRDLQRQLTPETAEAAGLDGDRPRPGEPQQRRDAELEDVDARVADEDPGEVIAEWLSDEEIDADPEVRRAQLAQRVREAQRVAERAVDEAAVPTRYHDIIRRYFGRLNENESN